jgi:hypothetical protein
MYFTISDIAGRTISEIAANITENAGVQISLNDLPNGIYVLSGFEQGGRFVGSEKFVKY